MTHREGPPTDAPPDAVQGPTRQSQARGAQRPVVFAVAYFATFVAVYAVTATWTRPVVNDVMSTAYAAWALGTLGTLDLSSLDLDYESLWILEVGEGAYSNRFPGLILSAAPAYALVRLDEPLLWPATLAAVVSSAAGVTALMLGLRWVLSTRAAVLGAGAVGLGSGVWAVGADTLWPHGVTTLWLGLLAWVSLARSRRSLLWAGAVAVMCVLSRPHLALATAVVGIVLWRDDRRRAVAVLLGTAVGAVIFWVYVRLVFGEWSATGPYAVHDYTRVLQEDPDRGGGEWLWRLDNLGTALFSPRVGLLVGYPVASLLLWSWIRDRTAAPRPLMALAFGGLAYGLLSVVLSRVSGGADFWGNRTLIEAVVLATPLAVWLFAHHGRGRLWRAAAAVAVAWSVAFHSLGALAPFAPPAGPDPFDVFYWQVPATVQAAPWWVVVLAAALGVVAGRLAWPQPASTPASTEAASST